VRDFATQQVRIAHDQVDAFDAALAQHRVIREQLELELEQSWNELLEILLPTLEEASLVQDALGLSLPDMDHPALLRQSEARRTALTAALVELEQDPAVRLAEDLCATMEDRRKSIDALLAPIVDAITRLEAEPHFYPLLDVSYDSSEYPFRFWHRAAYRHWRQARRLVSRHGERLGGARRFGALYKRYLHEKEAVRRLSLAREQVVARGEDLAAMAQRRREIEVELGSLPSWALTFARGRLREELAELDEEERAQLFAGHPTRLAAVRALATREARLRQLEQARSEYLDRPRAEVERALVKLLGLLSDLLGPSRKLDVLHGRDEMERDYGLPLARWRELRGKHEQTVRELEPDRSAAC
jgi:hypothetical protein